MGITVFGWQFSDLAVVGVARRDRSFRQSPQGPIGINSLKCLISLSVPILSVCKASSVDLQNKQRCGETWTPQSKLSTLGPWEGITAGVARGSLLPSTHNPKSPITDRHFRKNTDQTSTCRP